jgi:hypothetical protein
LSCPTPGHQRTATDCVPAGYLRLPHTGLKPAQAVCANWLPWVPLTQLAQAGNELCTNRLPLTACTGRSSTATGLCTSNYLGAPSHGSKAQQQAMCQQATLGCHTVADNRLCTNKPGYPSAWSLKQQQGLKLPAGYLGLPLPLLDHQTQQQTMYQQATLSCLTPGRSSTATGYNNQGYLGAAHTGRLATGYVPAGYLGLPHTGRSSTANRLCASKIPWAASHGTSSTATGYVPAGYLGAASGQLSGNRLCTKQATLELPHTGRSSTARLIANSTGYLDCPTRSLKPATGYVPAGYLGLPGRSSTATGYVPAGWAASHGSLKHSNGLCTSRLPWAASHGRSSTTTGCTRLLGTPHEVAQAQQQAVLH